jgi:hypothetical protein
MQLQSVRDLKAELLDRFSGETSGTEYTVSRVSPKISASGASSRFARSSALSSSQAQDPSAHGSIALGVSRNGGQYRLAIRIQERTLVGSPMVEKMAEKAKHEVDIRYIGRIDKCNYEPPSARSPEWWQRRSCRPVVMGCSVGHSDATTAGTGTLGAIVRRQGRWFALSNNHVLAVENRARIGDVVLQPGLEDGGSVPQDQFGSVESWITLHRDRNNVVDAALANIASTCPCDPTLLRDIVNGQDRHLTGVGPEFLEQGMQVYKNGRTTGARVGQITAFELGGLIVGYEMGALAFDNQIEIAGDGNAFSGSGDSGSLIVNEQIQAIGLLFARSSFGGAGGFGLTYANPIRTVLAELNVELPV